MIAGPGRCDRCAYWKWWRYRVHFGAKLPIRACGKCRKVLIRMK